LKIKNIIFIEFVTKKFRRNFIWIRNLLYHQLIRI
jgi:hypothetical protein